MGGLAVSPDGARLFALNVLGDTLTSIDLATRAIVKTVPLPAEPYAVVVSADGKTLFVSLWGGSKVLQVDAATLAVQAEIAVGEHPSALVLTARRPPAVRGLRQHQRGVGGGRRGEASASSRSRWRSIPKRRTEARRTASACRPTARPCSWRTPTTTRWRWSTSRSPARARSRGFIPTGWYPTAARFTRDGKRILVLSGQGPALRGEPAGPRGAVLHRPAPPRDASRVLPVPDATALAAYTKTVYRLTPYTDATRLGPGRRSRALADSAQGGGSVAHQARVLRDPREPDLRPGLR